jgi:hypothetical protein
MSLQHVEIQILTNHLRNQNAVLANLPFGVLRSFLPHPPGALNIAAATDIGSSKVVRCIYIMRVER